MPYSSPPPRRRPLRRLAVLAALVVAPGCTDAPTLPSAMQWLADGEEWVAVLPPEALPTAAAWARYGTAAADDLPLADQVALLEAGASAALARGDVEGAVAARRELAALLARSVDRAPDAALLRDATGAVALWTDRVRDQVRAEESPSLLEAVDSIGAAAERARRDLAAGDSVAAARALIGAGEAIRAWSPTLVAVRVLARAEQRLAALPAGDPDVARARHLVRTSRDALFARDPVRALQRALYALQIASGQRVVDPVPTDRVPLEVETVNR